MKITEEKILEIIQRNYNKYTGTNEAELHSAREIFELANQHPSPVSDEEIEKERIKRGYQTFQFDIGAAWMRSRLQQPVGIEWLTDDQLTELSIETTEKFYAKSKTNICFRALSKLQTELKSRVKVVDLDKLLTWLGENHKNLEYVDWKKEWSGLNRSLTFTNKELIDLYNQRTGGNDRQR